MPIFAVNAIMVIWYTILNYVLGSYVSITDIVNSFFFGKTIVPFGWYLQVCVLYYFMFYFSFKFSKTIKLGIITFLLSLVMFVLVSIWQKLGSTWYECIFSLAAGIFAAANYEKTSKLSSKFMCGITFILFSLFCFVFIMSIKDLFNPNIKLICKMASAVLFASIVYCGSTFLSFKGKILNWLGKHYLEIYIFQGTIILIADKYIKQENVAIYFSICLIGILMISAAMKIPIVKIIEAIRNQTKEIRINRL